jgi:hypothetical protein
MNVPRVITAILERKQPFYLANIVSKYAVIS